jgi:hypothetical protein
MATILKKIRISLIYKLGDKYLWAMALTKMRVLGLEPRTYGLKGRCSTD